MLFSVKNPHDGKTFENYTRFEWGVEVGVFTTLMLRLFVPHEFDMYIERKMVERCKDSCDSSSAGSCEQRRPKLTSREKVND